MRLSPHTVTIILNLIFISNEMKFKSKEPTNETFTSLCKSLERLMNMNSLLIIQSVKEFRLRSRYLYPQIAKLKISKAKSSATK